MIHFESMSRRNWQREYLEYLIGSINRKEINSKELVCLSTTIDLRPRNAQSIRNRLENVAKEFPKVSAMLLFHGK